MVKNLSLSTTTQNVRDSTSLSTTTQHKFTPDEIFEEEVWVVEHYIGPPLAFFLLVGIFVAFIKRKEIKAWYDKNVKKELLEWVHLCCPCGDNASVIDDKNQDKHFKDKSQTLKASKKDETVFIKDDVEVKAGKDIKSNYNSDGKSKPLKALKERITQFGESTALKAHVKDKKGQNEAANDDKDERRKPSKAERKPKIGESQASKGHVKDDKELQAGNKIKANYDKSLQALKERITKTGESKASKSYVKDDKDLQAGNKLKGNDDKDNRRTSLQVLKERITKKRGSQASKTNIKDDTELHDGSKIKAKDDKNGRRISLKALKERITKTGESQASKAPFKDDKELQAVNKLKANDDRGGRRNTLKSPKEHTVVDLSEVTLSTKKGYQENKNKRSSMIPSEKTVLSSKRNSHLV